MKNLFNNKKGMLGRDILISIIIFSMFVAGSFLIVSDMYSSYGVPYADNSSLYNKMADVNKDTQIMQDSLSSSGASPVGFLEYISTGAWQSLKLLINSGGIISSVVTQFGNDYNIPPVFILAFISITSITIIFSIISAIMRRKT